MEWGHREPCYRISVKPFLLHDAHGNYTIATRVGKLKGTFARNQIQKCDDIVFITQENIPETVTTAAKANSIGSGQCYAHCNSCTGCFNDHCKCRRKGLLCNSWSDSSFSCNNKLAVAWSMFRSRCLGEVDIWGPSGIVAHRHAWRISVVNVSTQFKVHQKITASNRPYTERCLKSRMESCRMKFGDRKHIKH